MLAKELLLLKMFYYKDEIPETWPDIGYEPQIKNPNAKKPTYICVPSNVELTR